MSDFASFCVCFVWVLFVLCKELFEVPEGVRIPPPPFATDRVQWFHFSMWVIDYQIVKHCICALPEGHETLLDGKNVSVIVSKNDRVRCYDVSPGIKVWDS